ncbi:oligopeptide transporter-like protein [Xylona heveae TC161]|uniref:Oligopeptide transporter-like protein n=1 Tax=Xylona heveae (strain CBS 132557 / TC161) TaxID=1328760 RepID=A0A161TGE9_XYLHT|nr:oligopeptide transporter-like protein [Xylona heveae TC161]KZF25227.1 oligopeptide transporter-like protein [Xylona heveae TC161]
MAPDRGDAPHLAEAQTPEDFAISSKVPYAPEGMQADETEIVDTERRTERGRRRSETRRYLAKHAAEGQNFTLRGIFVGLVIGIVICFSNTYFGLQTGWVSSMSMPSALIGFAYFKALSRYIRFPFTPVENVLVQTVAGSVGTMPLGCGFVGVIPALNFLLTREENGPLNLSTWKLILWSLGICFFGVVFAVPLRQQVIIREKLKFPSGTATALMIKVLHAGGGDGEDNRETSAPRHVEAHYAHENSAMVNEVTPPEISQQVAGSQAVGEDEAYIREQNDWKAKVKLLVISFTISALYTLFSYFVPQVRDVPILGGPMAANWLWSLNPSPAYIGQGIIMGPATTIYMLLGAIIGWGFLSPLAKKKGWAPGPVADWETGSKGWIVWVSLSIMLVDSIISLGWLALRPVVTHGSRFMKGIHQSIRQDGLVPTLKASLPTKGYKYMQLNNGDSETDALANRQPTDALRRESSAHETGEDGTHRPIPARAPSSYPGMHEPVDELPEVDAPPEHLISNRVVVIGLVVSIAFCIIAIHLTFGSLVPLYATITAVIAALFLSVMGVRALGETDLNPVSGISKLTQLLFALIVPSSHKNAVIINLLAGAVSESGALQAGDLMQDLKTGHLVGAAPKAQFYGQIIGSFVGAIVSAAVYKLYIRVYEVPGELFQVPTGYVWIFTARLVTGQGLPEMAWQWAVGVGIVFCIGSILRIAGHGTFWQKFIPGGIAVAVGMYNVPSFTLARTIGGLLQWYWRSVKRHDGAPVVIIASGLILGEGVFSIVNLLLASLSVPHL